MAQHANAPLLAQRGIQTVIALPMELRCGIALPTTGLLPVRQVVVRPRIGKAVPAGFMGSKSGMSRARHWPGAEQIAQTGEHFGQK